MSSGGWGDALRDALSGLGSEVLHPLTSAALAEDLIAMRKAIEGLEAQFSRRLLHFDRTHAFAATSSDSTQAFLRTQLHMTGAGAADRVRVARQLEELPSTFAVLNAGAISYTHAAMIARTADKVGREAFGNAEAILLPVAIRSDPSDLARCTRSLRHCIDGEGVLREDGESFERRWLDLHQGLEGMWFLNGVLDRETGDGLRTVLESLQPPPAADDNRRAWQRRADALGELVRRQLDGGELPRSGKVKPHLMLIASAETLRKEPGVPGADLQFGGMVAAETARRLACDCSVTAVGVDSDGEPVGLGRTRRLVNARLWRLLVLRDRGCRFPGCGCPVSWTDAHHLQAWIEGGKTEVQNLVLLCRRHHRKVHEGGWSIEWDSGGRLLAHPPPLQRARAA